MKLFDDLINKTYALLPTGGRSVSNFRDTSSFKGRKSELILGKEALYELGGNGLSCSVYAMYTQDKKLVESDEVIVYGPDIAELKEDCPFAKITIVRTDDLSSKSEQEIYDILEAIDLKKYDVYPEGYMIRISALSNREQVRVGKAAIKKGLTFADVGKMYIDKFHTDKHVQAVKVIFITMQEAPYASLDNIALMANNLLRALNHAFSDIKMDCSHCDWKALCDQVEGIKEMHQKMIAEKKK